MQMTMNSKSSRERHLEETARLRAELNETLDELQDKLDVAKRIDLKVAKLQELRRTKPLVFFAGAAGVTALAGLAVWGVVRYITKCK
jgi:hypothetical protein